MCLCGADALTATKSVGAFLQVQPDQRTHLPYCGECLRWRVPLCLICCQAPAIPGGAAQGGQKVHRSDSCLLLLPASPLCLAHSVVVFASWGFTKLMPITMHVQTVLPALLNTQSRVTGGDPLLPPPSYVLLYRTLWQHASVFFDASALLDFIL